MMTKLYKTRISSMLIISMVIAITTRLENAEADHVLVDHSVNYQVNSPGSVLHDRTKSIADGILRNLHGITQYNQVTNVNQLTNILSLYGPAFDPEPDWPINHTLRVGDFAGLTNLRTLDCGASALGWIPLGMFDDLVNLEHLTLSSGNRLTLGGFASLPLGLFDKLVNLKTLDFSQSYDRSGTLAALPSGLFDELVNLQMLALSNNELTTLPSGLFDELTGLRRLYLSNNDWASLPSGLFDELASLRTLDLSENRLTTLPSGLFDELDSLQTLNLGYSYWLTTLPSGLFDELTSLRTLDLRRSSRLQVSFDLFKQLINLRELGNVYHDGILPGVFSTNSVLHSMPNQMADAILNALGPSITHYNQVTNLAQLSGITSLNFANLGSAASLLQADHFEGLTGLRTLDLSQNGLTGLPAGVFDELAGLRTLDLSQNGLTGLPAGVFDELAGLRTLDLSQNGLTGLPAEIFDELAGLRTLDLSQNGLTGLPAGMFDELAGLRTLDLRGNSDLQVSFESLDRFTNLREVHHDGALAQIFSRDNILHGRSYRVVVGILNALGPDITQYNQVTNLAQLSGVTSLSVLYASSLQADDFAGLTGLRTLDLSRNGLPNLPLGIFDDLVNLRTLNLTYNRLTTLPAGIFDNLVDLQTLYLSNNDWASLPAGIFDELVNLQRLTLIGAELTTLPAGIFDNLVNLQTLALHRLSFSSLPAGSLDHLLKLSDINININAPALSPSSPLFSAVDSPGSVFHGRTRYVANKILDAISGVAHFNQVTNLAQLGVGISPLTIDRVTRLRAGDLAGLTRLSDLEIEAPLTSLPAGIFDDLTNLRWLRIYRTKLTTLPSGIFDKLAGLFLLDIHNNQLLTSLPAGIFDKIGTGNGRINLYLANNALTALPSGIFDNPRLGILDLSNNRLTTLPASERPFGRAYDVNLEGNPFTSFPFGIFDQYSSDEWRAIVRGIPSSLLSPTISLTPAALEIPEGNEENANAVFHVEVLDKHGLGSGSASVNYTTVDNTATAGEDYTAASGTLSFTSSSAIRTISIPILDDDVTNELPETFTLTLSNPTNAVFLGGASQLTATVTIIADNDAPPTVSFSNVPLNAHILRIPEGDEGTTNAVFQVELGQAFVSAQTNSVLYTTVDGGARAGEDYTETSGKLIFDAYTTNLTQTISIPILGDTLDEPNESFSVILVNPINSILQPKTVRIEIIDDDEPAPPPVNVNNGGGAVAPIITPHLSRNGGSTPGALMFNTEQVSLSESGSTTYQVRATSSQEREMVVNLETSHTGITINPNRLVFNQNTWQTYQTVTVTANADAADTNEQASIRHSIPASQGFIANNNAGTVSITLAHTIVEEEEETPDPQPERQEVQKVQMPPTDYDADDDGLIEISSLAQLNAIRWDLNGDGQPDKEEYQDAYNHAFPSAIANMGVPNNIPAQGYELTSDLDFDTNQNNQADEEDAFWNKGNGWTSIGLFSNPFQATLEGNGHGISNLFQDQSEAALFAENPSGLLGALGNRGQVLNVVLEEVDIKGVNWVGGIAGFSQGVISHCSVSGQVGGANSVGGFVGHNFGNIAGSVVAVEVSGASGVGAIAGWNVGGTIESSSAQDQEVDDLVGLGTPAR